MQLLGLTGLPFIRCNMQKNILFCLFVFCVYQAYCQKLTYQISFPEPHTHYIVVRIQAEIEPAAYLDIKIPNWTPGSYMIREFGRNIEAFSATDGKNPLKTEKITKSIWRVYTSKAKFLALSYKVYAFELSVRTSFVDASQALINGASVFVYADSWMNRPIELEIIPHPSWKQIAVALPGTAYRRTAPNYDMLVDSPIQLGNFETIEFMAAGVKHTVALVGQSNLNKTELIPKISAIVEASKKVFGHHPCSEYLFIIQMAAQGGGGLEHHNSTVLVCDRNSFGSKSGIVNFLALVAHEYFHLWNVKRLRPKELGPFDYQHENYTRLLWVAEGFTNYYDQKLLRACGETSPEDFLNSIATDIHNSETALGRSVQSLSESSLDAWIKYYKKNEMSANTTVSYYGYGAVIAALLDLEIIAATKGQKSLDDVMKQLYEDFYLKNNTGFTETDLLRALNETAKKDFSAFFEKHINGVIPPDYNAILSQAGLRLIREPHKGPQWAMRQKTEGGRLIITETWRGGTAYESGLSVNDEILAVHGQRASEAILTYVIQNFKTGDTVKVLVARDGLVKEIPVVLRENIFSTYKIEPVSSGESQKAILRKWLLID